MDISLIKYRIAKDGWPKLGYKLCRFLLTQYFHTLNDLRRLLKKVLMPASITKNINGFRMRLDLKNDEGISRDLYFFGTREEVSVRYLKESGTIKPGDIAMDIGANIGYYALLEAKLVESTGTVYALEPVSDSYQKFLGNIKLNQISNIQARNLALGDYNGSATIHIGRHRNWSSINGLGIDRFAGTETVDIMRGDDFLKDKPKPNFIRMDVEGYEYAVLQGLEETLRTADHLALHLEVHPDIMSLDQTRNLLELLKDNGFRRTIILFEPYSGWLDARRAVRPSIRWLTQKIGDVEKLGGAAAVPFAAVEEIFLKERKQLRVVFIKATS